jgi:hypothetical protein
MTTTADASRLFELRQTLELERQLRLKAEQKAAGLQSLNARLRAMVMRYRADEAEAKLLN